MAEPPSSAVVPRREAVKVILTKERLAMFHGQKVARAAHSLRVTVRELREAIAEYDDMMCDCSEEIIIADMEICARMQARANEFVATHPAGSLLLSGFNAWYYKNMDGIEQIPLGFPEPIPVGPTLLQFERALKSAGYILIETARGPRIYAPDGRFDMISGVAQALAWVRANPPGITRDLATYYARYYRAENVEDPRVLKTHFKLIVLYVHHHRWDRGGPNVARSSDMRAIRGIRFE